MCLVHAASTGGHREAQPCLNCENVLDVERPRSEKYEESYGPGSLSIRLDRSCTFGQCGSAGSVRPPVRSEAFTAVQTVIFSLAAPAKCNGVRTGVTTAAGTVRRRISSTQRWPNAPADRQTPLRRYARPTGRPLKPLCRTAPRGPGGCAGIPHGPAVSSAMPVSVCG